MVGWTGSCSQTIICAPSHHRTQCVCVVVFWQLPDIYRDIAIASASNTICTYDSWTTRADTYLHYIVYFILCILSPGRLIKKFGGMSWTEILYIFIVLFLIIYGTYFIMRRALAFGTRVRGLDHSAMCTAQRLRRTVGLLNCTSTCGARVWIAPRIGRILPPPPPHPVSVCTL